MKKQCFLITVPRVLSRISENFQENVENRNTANLQLKIFPDTVKLTRFLFNISKFI